MKKNIFITSVLILFILNVFSAINKNYQQQVKTEATNLAVSDVSTSKARVSYVICGENLTEIGVCYGTSSKPTISDKNTVTGYQGEAMNVPINISYKARINGLDQGKKYFVRAYVKNKAGKIFYSDEIQFTTEKDEDNFTAMLNGPKKEYYANGTIMKEYTLKDGQVDGELKFYDESGNLTADEYIKNGIQNGTCKYYHKNGQLYKEISLKDGVQNGPSVEFDEEGSLTTESNMTFDRETLQVSGEVKHFNKEGQMIELTTFSNGKLTYSIHKDSQGRTTSEQSDGNTTDYSYDRDGWKHTSINGEKCTCARCSENSNN